MIRQLIDELQSLLAYREQQINELKELLRAEREATATLLISLQELMDSFHTNLEDSTRDH